MIDILVSYSLIKSIYETKKDYLDVFVPFLLASFPEGEEECGSNIMAKNIKEKFGLEIPEYTLTTIIKKAKRNDFIDWKQNKCSLKVKGKNYLSEIKLIENEERGKIITLIEDIKNFFASQYKISLNSTKILEILNIFLKTHQLPLINFFNPKSIQEEWPGKFDKYYEFYLVEYIKLAKEQKPDVFNILEKMFYGAIFSTILFKKNIPETNKKFNTTQIFLDTNFVFRILDFDYSFICKPAKELFELLKKDKKFQLKVFDFTIDEMVRVLKEYGKEEYKYFPKVKVASIYSNLKNKGWTKEDCINFISKIEKEIYNLEINIEYTNVDLNKWEIPINDIYSKIIQYKPEQKILAQKHDVCAIEKIREIRKHSRREIENCGALFLTSDLRLTRFNFIELGHKEKATVPEVISDRFLTTLLWLKNPVALKELPLETILSTQTEILIDRKVWNRFYDNLTKLKNEGKISDEDIATLIYFHLEQELAPITNPEEITPEFILEEIEKNKKKIEETTKEEITKEIKKITQRHREEITKKEQEFLNDLEAIKNDIKESVWKEANNKVNKRFIFGVLLLITVTVVSGILLFNKFKIGSILSFLLAFLQFLGFKIDILKIKEKQIKKVFEKIYEKRLSTKIEEIKKKYLSIKSE
jgi:hypothetical protein